MIFSIAGGTGSGMGSYVLEKLADRCEFLMMLNILVNQREYLKIGGTAWVFK